MTIWWLLAPFLLIISRAAPKTETTSRNPPTAKHFFTPFNFTIQIIPILKCSLGFIQKDITWRINRSYNYVALVKLCIGFAYVIKWAKLEKVPERVRSIRKLATSMQAQAQKHISKQNVGENGAGQECDKVGNYRYEMASNLMNMGKWNLRKMDIGTHGRIKLLWWHVIDYHQV